MEHFSCRFGMEKKMVIKLIEMELPVGEKLVVAKNRICSREDNGHLGRISIVSGIHGDELEGQYVCYEVARRIAENPMALQGIVDIYPAVNPIGVAMSHRNMPRLEMDMNRIFPGNSKGDMFERAAASVVEDLIGSDICIDIHASNIFVKEIPQVRLDEESADRLLPFAKLMNVDMIWVNASETVHEATLAYSMNVLGVPSMVVEMGQGSSISRAYGNQVVDGIFNLMYEMGLWTNTPPQAQMPVISSEGKVEIICSETDGLFLPCIGNSHYVKKGDTIGEIVDPWSGERKQSVLAGKDGLVFTLRIYPVVYPGDLIARVVTDIT